MTLAGLTGQKIFETNYLRLSEETMYPCKHSRFQAGVPDEIFSHQKLPIWK
jgi:hypothetical protein